MLVESSDRQREILTSSILEKFENEDFIQSIM